MVLLLLTAPLLLGVPRSLHLPHCSLGPAGMSVTCQRRSFLGVGILFGSFRYSKPSEVPGPQWVPSKCLLHDLPSIDTK